MSPSPASPQGTAEQEAKRQRRNKWESASAADVPAASNVFNGLLASCPNHAGGDRKATTAVAVVDTSTVVSLDQSTLARRADAELASIAFQERNLDKSRPRVFVGNVDPAVTETEIMQIFSAVGAVTGIDMPREGSPPTPKGYCFVEFAEQAMVNRAIGSLQDFLLGGRHLRVSSPQQQRRASFGLKGALAVPPPAPGPSSGLTFKKKIEDAPAPAPAAPAVPMRPGEASGSRAAVGASRELARVTVSGIPSTIEAKDIRALLQQFGAIVRCDVLPPMQSNPAPRFAGRVLVEFQSEQSAYGALRSLQNKALGGAMLHLQLGSPGGTATELTAAPSVASVADISTIEPPLPSIFASAATAAAKEEVDEELAAKMKASPILLLENMVGPGEADEDLAGEVREECARFGEVEQVNVREEGRKRNVQIYVHFKTAGSREKAQGNLAGRWFGGRQVRATPHVEEDSGFL